MRLPDFLIIGGMRCGTTSLHSLLREHPKLCFPPKKEIHFFDKRNSELGTSVQRYAALFAACPGDCLCGEATPDYLTTEGCDRFIHDVAPRAKLIILLRNPIDRAWSHYLFSEFKQVETLDFRAALDQETERLQIKSNHSDIFFSYLQRGRYLEHITRFEALFGHEQLKVLFFEELIMNTRLVLDDLLQFLGLSDSSMLGKVPHLNKIVNSRGILNRIFSRFTSPPVMPDPDRQYLRSYFADPNERLASWLDRALPWD